MEVPVIPDTPNHLRYEVWKAFEDVIAVVVNNWPQPQVFTPKDYAVTTFAARLRDAMTSHITYRWPSEKVNVDKLTEIRSSFAIVPRNGKVFVEPRVKKPKSVGSIDELLDDSGAPPAIGFSEPIAVDLPTQTDVFALAHLIHRRIISGPIRFTNAQAIAEWSPRLTQGYDIALQQEEEGTWIML